MSWYFKKVGYAGKLAGTIEDDFRKVLGCPSESAEEDAKNKLGSVAATLCESLVEKSTVVCIEASGSAWNTSDGARNQTCSFKLDTIGILEE